MKNLRTFLVPMIISFTVSFANAGKLDHLNALSGDPGVLKLEFDFQEKGLFLQSIEDTGERFRCDCSIYKVTFKEDEKPTVEQYMVQVEGGPLGEKPKVTILPK